MEGINSKAEIAVGSVYCVDCVYGGLCGDGIGVGITDLLITQHF